MKLLVVLGSGGHTKEMIRLVHLLGGRYRYAYLVASDDQLSPLKIVEPGPVYRVLRPRWKDTSLIGAVIRTIAATLQSLLALIRARPHAVISAGPGPAVPASILAKLLGIKVIYIETGSRVFAPSSSGRILYRFADLFLVQWPELLEHCPRAVYAGRFF